MPDYTKLRNLSAREIIAALGRDGFWHARTNGRGVVRTNSEESKLRPRSPYRKFHRGKRAAAE